MYAQTCPDIGTMCRGTESMKDSTKQHIKRPQNLMLSVLVCSKMTMKHLECKILER